MKLEAEGTQVRKPGPKGQGLKVTFWQAKAQLSTQTWVFWKGIVRLHLFNACVPALACSVHTACRDVLLPNLPSKAALILAVKVPLSHLFSPTFLLCLVMKVPGTRSVTGMELSLITVLALSCSEH